MGSNYPFVAVVIPVNDGEDIIGGCIEALGAQDYPRTRFEVLIVDDASTDDTAGVLEEIAARERDAADPLRLRYIRQSWAGAGAARNRGARETSADIVLFTDADCRPVPGWISAMVAPFEDREVAGVGGGYLSRQTSWVARLAQAEFEQRYALLARHRTIDIAFTHSASFRRSVFLEHHGFDERMPNNADDLEFAYRLATSGHRLVFAPDGLVHHRHPETLLEYVKKKFGRAYWRMLVYKHFPGKVLKDTYTPQVLKAQIALLGVTVASGAAALALGSPVLGAVGAASFLGMAATTVPFALGVRGPMWLRLAAMPFLVSRTLALGSGTVAGLLHRMEDYHRGGRAIARTRDEATHHHRP